MVNTDYFEVEIDGVKIGVSQSRTQYRTIYRFDCADYRIEEKNGIYTAYLKDDVYVKFTAISKAWKMIRNDIINNIRSGELE